METEKVVQGRRVTGQDIALICSLLADNPAWGRRKLSIELCSRWDWRNGVGQLKDMACRTLLLKLERAGEVQLPPRQRGWTNAGQRRHQVEIPHERNPIESGLKTLQPVQVETLETGNPALPLFKSLLQRYHYLGHKICVGENLKYLFRDRWKRILGCMLFGSAAWKAKARDDFIGWDRVQQQRHLFLLTNNTRFLILPWVRVPHLASHLLALTRARLSADWMNKYGHAIHLLETFVERERFRGTCYRAAGWIRVGATTGRSRNDVANTLRVPVKDIYLCPLAHDFREKLGVTMNTPARRKENG